MGWRARSSWRACLPVQWRCPPGGSMFRTWRPDTLSCWGTRTWKSCHLLEQISAFILGKARSTKSKNILHGCIFCTRFIFFSCCKIFTFFAPQSNIFFFPPPFSRVKFAEYTPLTFTTVKLTFLIVRYLHFHFNFFTVYHRATWWISRKRERKSPHHKCITSRRCSRLYNNGQTICVWHDQFITWQRPFGFKKVQEYAKN